MKNKLLMALLIFCFFTLGLYAQNPPAVDSRLVGTWEELDGTIWVFNSSGDGTISGESTIRFTFFSNFLIIYGETYQSAFEYTFSKDGQTILLLMKNSSYAALLKKKR